MIDNNATPTTTIDWSDHNNEDSSIFDPSYTYSNDKYSCIVAFYHIHIVLNYIIFLSGLACLVTRLIPGISGKYNLHSWFGRIYILAMLWSTSVSLLINNEGLPTAVLVSFIAVMGGLTLGWILIIIYKQNINAEATQIVQKKLVTKLNMNGNEKNNKGSNTNRGETINLNKMMNVATLEIVNSKTFAQRFFSLKAAHGILFFVSWMQIAGRIFNSGDGEFSCRTYPAFKPIFDANNKENNKLKLVPMHDPRWDEMPWSDGPVTWALLIIMASIITAIIGGALFSLFFLWRSKKQTKQRINQTIIPMISSSLKDIEEEEDVKREEQLLTTSLLPKKNMNTYTLKHRIEKIP